MGYAITPLCAERHYMGSAARGRFATDRSVRPDYSRVPSPHELAQRRACRPANKTRYLREQRVVALVLDCRRAKDELAWGEGALARLHDACEAAVAAGNAEQSARIERVMGRLQEHLDQTLAFRRETSRELRLIGISPKEEACILRETLQRTGRAEDNAPATAV